MKDKKEIIESKDQLTQYLRDGEKSISEFRIGTEHEKFVFNIHDNSPVPYEGDKGIKSLLLNLTRFGWKEVLENNNVIALERDESLGGGSITLEPGGQFELSGAKLKDIHETFNEIYEHKNQVSEVAAELGLGFLGIGFTPDWKRENISIMPKQRYDIMRSYMPKKGQLGLDMMLRSSTIQVNLDYSSEEDMIRKFRFSLVIQPIVTAIFSNSPVSDGKLNNYKSYRGFVWTDTDPDRTGMLPFVFDKFMSYESYVDYAIDVPMYFVYREGNYIDLSGKSFRDFLNGRLNEMNNEQPTMSDWELHLTTIFPEVRLKKWLEMRGADAGNLQSVCALSAFWTGLLYEESSLNNAYRLLGDIDIQELNELRLSCAKNGLESKTKNINVLELGKDLLEISHEGLRKRKKLNAEGEDESIFLSPVSEILKNQRSPADIIISNYYGDWEMKIENFYKNCMF